MFDDTMPPSEPTIALTQHQPPDTWLKRFQRQNRALRKNRFSLIMYLGLILWFDSHQMAVRGAMDCRWDFDDIMPLLGTAILSPILLSLHILRLPYKLLAWPISRLWYGSDNS